MLVVVVEVNSSRHHTTKPHHSTQEQSTALPHFIYSILTLVSPTIYQSDTT